MNILLEPHVFAYVWAGLMAGGFYLLRSIARVAVGWLILSFLIAATIYNQAHP